MAEQRNKHGAVPAANAVSGEDMVKEAEHKMQRSIEALQEEFHTIRTGRATPSMLDKINVEYYGTPTPLNQVANVSVPDPRTLVISPWEKTMFGPIEKAIQKSDLGIMPNNDGKVIRLNIPMLTEQRRKDLVKIVHKRAEEGRVAVRNCRRDALDRLKRAEKDRSLSEDDGKRFQDRLQKLTDRFVAEVDRASANKEKEVLEV